MRKFLAALGVTVALVLGLSTSNAVAAAPYVGHHTWQDAKCDVAYNQGVALPVPVCGVIDIKSVTVDYTKSRLAVTVWFFGLTKEHGQDFIVSVDADHGRPFQMNRGTDFGSSVIVHGNVLTCALHSHLSFTDRVLTMWASPTCLRNRFNGAGDVLKGHAVRISAEVIASDRHNNGWYDALGNGHWTQFVHELK